MAGLGLTQLPRSTSNGRLVRADRAEVLMRRLLAVSVTSVLTAALAAPPLAADAVSLLWGPIAAQVVRRRRLTTKTDSIIAPATTTANAAKITARTPLFPEEDVASGLRSLWADGD